MNTFIAVPYGILFYLAAVAGPALCTNHSAYGALIAVAPIALFHFGSGLRAIGGLSFGSASGAVKLRYFALAVAATILCAACAILLSTLIPLWMPQKPALAVICASWVAGASLAAYRRRSAY